MKVLIKINDNTLSFSNRKKLSQEYKNMLNTNVISNDELVFSDAYINENPKLVSSFLNELINSYNINTIRFQNMEIAELIFTFIYRLKNIESIYFESDEVLPYTFCEKLCKLNNLKYVSAQYIPQYIFEKLDKYDIIPESRNEVLFTSNFMEINSLNTYASLYYKYSVYLDFPLSKEDIDDFTSFCKINRYLKTININIPNKFNLEDVINILKEYNHKYIKIIIHGDITDLALIDYLKNNNKIITKKYKISLKLKYSDKYIKENIAKETNNIILKSCAYIMIAIALISIGYLFYDNYESMLKGAKMSEEIQEKIDTYENTNKVETESATIKGVKNEYFYALQDINPETVGWLKVNNTNIDYPIVHHSDNSYYLENNIYNEPDRNGWLFLDYENNGTTLDDNNIIYGHNRYINGVMFGTLRKTLYKDWYENPDNLIISYKTLLKDYEFKVFSIYVIKTTSDYLVTSFNTDEEKLEFINMIASRSQIDLETPKFNKDTKILTLSTCQSDTTRLVVHAYLVNES